MSVASTKAAVRERDGNCCTECRMTNEGHVARYGASLEVHRLVPGSAYSLEGSQLLCKPCHGPKPKSPCGAILPTPFGGPLRRLRLARGLSVAALAAAADLSRSLVYELERGAYAPGWDTLLALAGALGCRLDDFRGGG